MNSNEANEFLRNLRDKILETQDDSTPNDKFLLSSNVLTQIKANVPELITNQSASKLLEKLIKLLELSLLEDSVNDLNGKVDICIEIFKVVIFKCSIETIAKDIFASHFLQTLLQCALFFSKYNKQIHELIKHLANTIE